MYARPKDTGWITKKGMSISLGQPARNWLCPLKEEEKGEAEGLKWEADLGLLKLWRVMEGPLS